MTHEEFIQFFGKESGNLKPTDKIYYHIRVAQTKYPDYPCYSFYDIDAPNYNDAEKEARTRFSSDFGFEFKDTEAYTFDQHIIDYAKLLASGYKPNFF